MDLVHRRSWGVYIGFMGFALAGSLHGYDATPRRVFAAYWSTAAGDRSVVQLHNNLIDDSLVVRPVLFSPTGTRIELPAIQIAALGNVSLDMLESLKRQGGVLQTGSAMFEYQYKHGGSLAVEIAVTQPSQTFSYTVIGTEYMASAADLSAVFWLPSNEAEVYLAVQNTSTARLHVSASLQVGGPLRPIKTVSLGSHESQVIRVPVGRFRVPQVSDRFGGVILSHDGEDGALNTSGWIEDESTGYSTMMTFDDPVKHKGTSLFGAQVLLGAQTKFLASGAPLSIDSYVVLFNTSPSVGLLPQAELSANINGQAVRIPLHVGFLGPQQVTEIDLGDLVKDGLIPAGVSSANLKFSYDGPDGVLMGRVFGIGSDPTFGFYTALESTTVGSISCVYWSTIGDSTPILTVANFADKPDNVNVAVTYNGGVVVLPQLPLNPLQSVTINLRDLKEQGVLPIGADFGGLRVFGSLDASSKLLVKDHVVSESQRTASPFYGQIVYAYYAHFDPSSYDVPVDGTAQGHVVVEMSDASQRYDPIPSLSSESTSIATIGDPAWTSPFWSTITGVADGTTYIDSQTTAFPTDPYGSSYGPLYAQAFVRVRGPNHVKIISDTNGFPASCPGGYYPVYRRQMFMQVVDSLGRSITKNISVKEVYTSGPSTNNCPGGDQPSAESCYPTSSGTFTDILTVANSAGPGCSANITNPAIACGFTLTATWPACSNGYSNNLWTSPRSTLSNGITANGNSSTIGAGTQLYP